VEMLKFIPDFKRKNNIEKLTLITLSDGAGGTLRSNFYASRYRSGGVAYKNFIVDRETEKTYDFDGDACNTTDILLRMIKDRYDITTLGFYICHNSRNVLSDAYYYNTGSRPNAFAIEEIRDDFRQKGFHSMSGTGRDDLFVIPNSSTKIVDEELNVSSAQSAAAIARKLSRNMGNKKHSRILLDKFISYVA
jgi:hypothetical protein